MSLRWALFVGLLLVGCSSESAEVGPGATPPGSTIIVTDKGAVEGAALEGTRAFLGIPYAAPPVGALRWKPPTEASQWSATRPALAAGQVCPQVSLITGKPTGEPVEDCLYLNVWTPLAAPSKPAPVMVFIHGGGFVLGSGSERTYDGTNLASAGAIVVTLNYRLGAFGFLEHATLAAEAGQATAPSYGLLDQRAALQWVKKNAAAFGGDPNNVTLFGESAGAISVCAHLAMPRSRGLFHRAIIESGSCGPGTVNSPETARKQGDEFAKALGCTDLACMRAKTTTEVVNALNVRAALFGKAGVSWSPTFDGPELPQIPNDVFAAGGAAPVPVILGTTKDEGSLFTYLWRLAFNHELTEAELSELLQLLYSPAQIERIQAEYAASKFGGTVPRANALLTDGLFVCPTRRTARALAGHGSPTYLYQFSYPFNPPLFPNIGVAHLFELPFVFGTGLGGRDIGDEEFPTSKTIIGYWSRFAASGDPNGGGAVVWPRYDAGTDSHLVLDASFITGSGLRRAACDFWDTL